MARLPEQSLKLAIANAVVDKIKLEELLEKLWREDPTDVTDLFNSITGYHISESYRLQSYAGRIGQFRKRKLKTRHKTGLTLNAIARRKRLPLSTMTSLLEHHGLLELVQFGLDQRRRMVTDKAFEAGLGHNVYPANRIGHLEGHGKAAPFPVFYADRLDEIMWMLDLPGIRKTLRTIDGKQNKLRWLFAHHSYLPDNEITNLTGYSRRGVIKARGSIN